MTKIILNNKKEYFIPVGGTNSSADKLIIKLITDESYEDVRNAFSDSENVKKIISATEQGGTLMVYEGYTQLDSKGTVDENYIVENTQYDADGSITKEAVTGKVITVTLYKPSSSEQSDSNEFDAIWKEARKNG